MADIQYVSAAQAVQCVKSGDGVYFQGSTAIPEILQQAFERKIAFCPLW